MHEDVPIIDLTSYRSGADKASVAQAVDRACREIGFLVVSGHGVPADLVAETERLSHAFFDLPLEEKMKVARTDLDVLRGYVPVAAESLARSMGVKAPGDLNESFMIGEPDPPNEPYFQGEAAGNHFAPNLWPERPPEAAAGLDGLFSRDGASGDRHHAGVRTGARSPGKLLRRQDRSAHQPHSRPAAIRRYRAAANPRRAGQVRIPTTAA